MLNSTLSVVVRVVGGTSSVRRCLARLAPQASDDSVEIIVPYDSTVGSVAHLQTEFPRVRFVDMGVVRTRARPDSLGVSHELYDLRATRGLLEATGDIVALLEDYGAPAPDWCQQVRAAHKLPHSVIGGVVEQENRGTLNWAVYFVDFGRYQPPLLEGPSEYLTDVNVSYKRASLQEVKSVWSQRYNEVTTHWALASRGGVLWMRPQMVVWEDRGHLHLSSLIRERLAWGRLFGATRARASKPTARALYVVSGPLLPLVLLRRILTRGFAKQHMRRRAQFIRALPAIVVLLVAWCFGEWLGYLTSEEYR